MPIEYPQTRRDDVVETLHGREIADPYRWLEDPDAEDTAAWVAAQNAVTQAYLSGIEDHAAWSEALRDIVLRPTVGAVSRTGGWYVVPRNSGEQPQPTYYAARTLDELESGGRVLLDPSSWSEAGTSSVNAFGISDDGRLLAYAVSEGGSDWQRIKVKDVESGTDLDVPDVISRFTQPVWLPGDNSFLTLRYDVETQASGTETAALPAPTLVVHPVDGGEETVVLELEKDSHQIVWPQLSSDRGWLALTVMTGTERSNDLYVARLRPTDSGCRVGPLLRLTEAATDQVLLVDVVDDIAYLTTDRDAPRQRVVRVDLRAAEQAETPAATPWADVVPQQAATLSGAVVAGDVIVTEHLVDAAPVLTRHSLGGSRLGVLDIEAGSVVSLDGEAGRDELLVTVNTITAPNRTVVVRPSDGHTRVLHLGGDPAGMPEVVVERCRATSADGTEVPYWLVRRADAAPGPLPTFLYGYGGFDVPLFLTYSPTYLAWLQAGGAVAVANLRGGGEFGREWYDAGRRAHKQHTFDDAAAVAQQLVADGATTCDRLAVHGGSNGGLLVGALLTQHPDLFAAAAPAVGVLDMLRFHRFTMGAAWISDYGDPDVVEDFEVALAYSPLHNVQEGRAYPATMVLTGDHDDRVVPAHSHKFTATLQRAQGGDAPVLSRIETSTGHGMGKPRAVLAQETADMLAFLAAHTGLRRA